MKKICLITGSCGLVGFEACNFFSQKNFKIIGIDNNFRKKYFGKKGSILDNKKAIINSISDYEHYSLNINNYQSLSKIFKKYGNNIKLIIHAAAQPSHDWSYKNPRLDFNVNAFGTLNLLDLTKKYSKNAIFIFTSTNKVYGDNPNKLKYVEKKLRYDVSPRSKYTRGFNEDLNIDQCVHSIFGASKLSADIMVQEYCRNLKIKGAVFRAGCITGANHKGVKLHGFLSFLVKTILQKKTYEIIGYKGKQVRDNIHSIDLIKAFWEFYKKPRFGEVYNIGGSRVSNCSILEAIKLTEKISGIKAKIKLKKINRVGDHKWWISDVKKFSEHYLQWKITKNTETIIKELIHSYRT